MQARSSTWISTGFEELVYRSHKGETASFDIVIVGSGYGAAIAAAELAGCRERGAALKVCVLERGDEYLPGMFPSRMADLPRHVRASVSRGTTPKGQRQGLFDFRLGPDVSALVANGLGGGSLINAGVMVAPKAAVFDRGWPAAVKNDSDLMDYYERAKRLLGAADTGGDNTIDRHDQHRKTPLRKHAALKLLATDRQSFQSAPVTVAMADKRNSGGVNLAQCQLCGDCVTGCNHNAKDSLDTNLLVRAKQKGAEIFTGATVLRIEKADRHWLVHTVPTGEKLRQCQPEPLAIKAGRVILAAGTFGSTEILMRSASPALQFSERLGQGFSTNGDMVAAGFSHRTPVNAVASEHQNPAERQVGPTITGMIDCAETGLLVEELAVPGPIRRAFEELVTTANSFRELVKTDVLDHNYSHPHPDPYAVDEEAIGRTAVYAVMGDDEAKGALELIEDGDGDGAIRVHWPGVGRQPLFDKQISLLQRGAEASGLGGTVIPNPLWRLLPASMASLFGDRVGPALTVHPLGGCGMGDDRHQGVVDHLGRVFNAAATHADDNLHRGLVVLDGSVMASALGVNPALSIAAIALRAVEALRDEIWQLQCADNQYGGEGTRPVVADMSVAEPYRETQIRLTERVAGRAVLTGTSGEPLPCVIDITLSFNPKSLRLLTRTQDRTLTVNRDGSQELVSGVRIFRQDDWERLKKQGAGEALLDRAALLVAPVSGTLTLLRRSATHAGRRRWGAIYAWLLNRGLRDAWQSIATHFDVGRHLERGGSPSVWQRLVKKIKKVRALASHAGEIRLFEYDLIIHKPATGWATTLQGFAEAAELNLIRAEKRICYARKSNPLRQLEEMWLLDFPGLRPLHQQAAPPFLRYDSTFLARRNKPLISIVSQQDQPTALADVGSFLAYFARLLIGTHVWSFRQPDPPSQQQPDRLPGRVPGLPAPQITELDLDRGDRCQPIRIRLSRYPRAGGPHPPLLLIHGYSASGNTYTHPAIRPNTAQFFWRQQRDVWVLDLRTSSGMATASSAWTFEDVAHADIPVALDHIFRVTGKKCDVIAHCMGAAMLSMAVLSPPGCGDRHYAERKTLPGRINKVVLSQVGPRVVFTPANIFRAYLLNYVRHLLPEVFYSFRAAADESPTMQILDRLLAALPYPEEEFDLENPVRFWQRKTFVSTRHRLDGLYGRAFSLKNMPAGLLRHIDDLFGPLNLGTLGQVIHFSLWEQITSRAGRNDFATRENLKKRWIFPTLSVHGDENGLVDIATLTRMREMFVAAGLPLETAVFKGCGHQDSLIGSGAAENFASIQQFLEAPPGTFASLGEYDPLTAGGLLVELPYSGPVIGARFCRDGKDYISVGVGTSPARGRPELIMFLAVRENRGRLQPARVDDNATPLAPSLCLKLAVDAVDDWYKVALPLAHGLDEATALDGYLVFFVYDRGIELGELTYGKDLPDNLLALLDETVEAAYLKNVSGFTPDKQRLKDYLEQLLNSGQLSDATTKTLTQPATALRAGLIEIPPPASADASEVHFVFGSCQYPAGMMDAEDAFASYRRLSAHLDRAVPAPEFALLMGDQIYADPSAGLFDPTHRDDRYTGTYHKWLHNHHVKMVLRRLPSCMMLDDHEIQNDWDLGDADVCPDFLLDGRSAYLNFQRHLQQPAQPPAGDADCPLWYEFTHGGLPFFMADTRSERQQRNAVNLDSARIFSDAQCADIEQWLLRWQRRWPFRPKFIVSPSVVLPRRLYTGGARAHALRSDAWDGYPFSLHRLLGFILEHEINNLVFLSGDEHLSSVADITLSDPQSGRLVQLHSIHSSGFYIPLPFVNTQPAELAGHEDFSFAVEADSPGEYRCQVATQFIPGSGYAAMQVVEREDRWHLCCEFDRAAGTQTFNITLMNEEDVAAVKTGLALNA